MTTKETTKIHRKSAITVGVLFIVGTVAGILSGVLTEPILGDPDYLIKIAANETSIRLTYDQNTSSRDRSTEISITGEGDVLRKAVITQTGALPYLEASPDDLGLEASPGEVIIQIQSNVEWSVTNDDPWISLEIVNAGELRIQYDANTEPLPRTGIILLQGSGELRKLIALTQASESITFHVSPNIRKVEASSGMASFHIHSNVHWDASVDASWMFAAFFRTKSKLSGY